MSKSSEKATGAFRTIREVADWLTVPTHVLRFWESKFDQIAPVKGPGGRRYYRPEDMRLLGGIKVMLHDQGLTIRGVVQKIEEEGVAPVMELAPELTMPEAAPSRNRRVIRTDPPEETRVVPFERARETEGAPADPDAAADQPDTPQDAVQPGPADDAPQPVKPAGAPLPDMPEQPADDAASPAAPADAVEADATAPSNPVDIAPGDDDRMPGGPAPDLPPTPPDTPPQPAPTSPETPPTLELPPMAVQHVPPAIAALRLARQAAPVDAGDQRRLRRVVRRLRGLIEEIEDELDVG